VFVTCHRGHEDRCVGELYSMFDEFHQRLWPNEESKGDLEEDEEEDETVDIEDSIKAELGQLKTKKEKRPFYSVKMSQECGTFEISDYEVDDSVFHGDTASNRPRSSCPRNLSRRISRQ